jgi:predicted O-methyltransferase YrrM
LGITTAYLAQNQPHSSVYTLDGCAGSLAEAQGVWHNLGLADRIYPTLGNIDDTLPAVLAKGPFSLIILDANHKSGPVRQYFEAVLPYVHPEGCIVLDDIYWTPDMTAAWHAISGDPRVLQSVDLYRQGWLFFRQSQVREQFRLRALG